MQKLVLIAILFTLNPSARSLAQHHTGSHAHHSSHHSSSHHSHHTPHVRSHGERRRVHYSNNHSTNFIFFRRGCNARSGGNGYQSFAPLKGIHDISAGVGVASAWQITDNYVTSATPNCFASYRYFVSNRCAFGLSAGTQTMAGRDSSLLPGKGPLYSFQTSTYTVALEFSWIWYSRKALQVYGCVAGGVSYFKEHDNYPDMTASDYSGYKFNGQLTIAGLRVGKTLGAFAELGIGYKGLLNAGISYQPGYRRAHKQS